MGLIESLSWTEEQGLETAELFKPPELISVSYTHLDVYKRQVGGESIGKLSMFHGRFVTN